MGTVGPKSFLHSDMPKAAMLILALAGSIFLTINLTYKPPTPRPFSFLETVPSKGSSIAISQVNGRIFATTWAQSQVLINGTIVVTGEGATPDNVQIQEQNNGGLISFQPMYNDKTAGRSYLVNVNLFVPTNANFTGISLGATDDGTLQLDNLNLSRLDVSSWAGRIQMNLSPLPSGYYSIVTYNGGSVDLKIPASTSFALSAKSGFGYDGQVVVHGFNQCHTAYSGWAYSTSNTGATINCGDHSATITVQTQYIGGIMHTGDITIGSV
jgi:hypothetical protein